MTDSEALTEARVRDIRSGFIIDSGVTFALLPVKCIDGRWAWLRKVGWADWNPTMFLNPYQTERIYDLGRKP